jgi:nitrite reductase/ring-hydroxylating ferredoxin subunit
MASVAVSVLAAAFLLVTGSPAHAAQKPKITLDQRKAAYTLDDAIARVRTACEPHPDKDLVIDVREPTYDFSITIVCSAGLAMPDKFIRQPLVAAASSHRDAGARANAVVDLQEALPPAEGLGYEHDEMVWAIAGSNGVACRRAQSQQQILRSMSEAAQANRETPEHWTLVEAVFLTGVCPDKLPDLYENVAALGNPIAAQAVKQMIDRRPMTLPLATVPHGVSERTVASRAVFLERRGDRVTTFLTDVHHLPGEAALWYCPKERVFVSPTHAETFDLTGRVLDGPATRGLDRFTTAVDGNHVIVHLADVIRGNDDRPAHPPALSAEVAGNWDTAPDTFCFQALKITPSPLG